MGVGNNVFDNSRYGEGYGEDKSPTVVSLPNATGIGNYAFAFTDLISINIPNVRSIGDHAFEWNIQYFYSIDLPNVNSIGEYAFADCSNLSSINCPNVCSIGYWAFGYCSELTSITLPKATTIGEYVFNGCSEDLVIDLSENTNFSVANEATYRENWAVPEGATIIFHDSPQ